MTRNKLPLLLQYELKEIIAGAFLGGAAQIFVQAFSDCWNDGMLVTLLQVIGSICFAIPGILLVRISQIDKQIIQIFDIGLKDETENAIRSANEEDTNTEEKIYAIQQKVENDRYEKVRTFYSGIINQRNGLIFCFCLLCFLSLLFYIISGYVKKYPNAYYFPVRNTCDFVNASDCKSSSYCCFQINQEAKPLVEDDAEIPTNITATTTESPSTK